MWSVQSPQKFICVFDRACSFNRNRDSISMESRQISNQFESKKEKKFFVCIQREYLIHCDSVTVAIHTYTHKTDGDNTIPNWIFTLKMCIQSTESTFNIVIQEFNFFCILFQIDKSWRKEWKNTHKHLERKKLEKRLNVLQQWELRTEII